MLGPQDFDRSDQTIRGTREVYPLCGAAVNQNMPDGLREGAVANPGKFQIRARGTGKDDFKIAVSPLPALRARAAQGTILGQGLLYDEDGNLRQSIVAADINGDGVVDAADLALILSLFGSTCDCYLVSPTTCNQAEFTRADIDGDCAISLTDLSTLLNYFGTTGDTSLERTFVWDVENRLVATGPTRVFGSSPTPQNGDTKIEFRYDYRGRRIEKKVSTHNGTAWSVTSTQRFVWNGWHAFAVLRVSMLFHAACSPTRVAPRYNAWHRSMLSSPLKNS